MSPSLLRLRRGRHTHSAMSVLQLLLLICKDNSELLLSFVILVLYYYISDKPIVSLIHQYTNIFSLKIPPPDNYEGIIKFSCQKLLHFTHYL